MLARMIVRWILLAVVIGVVAKITPGIHVYGGFGTLLWVALLFGFIDAVIGPLLRLVSLPIIVLTLGLFVLVVNAALLGLTAQLTSHLDIDSFGSAVLGGFLIAIFTWVAEQLIPGQEHHRHWQVSAGSMRMQPRNPPE